jgi:ABC-type thiamin/hydroxymethylpyrimidine transport system permease subunit
MSFMLAIPIWMSTLSGRWEWWRKLLTALFCFLFCGVFLFTSGMLNELAQQHLTNVELGRFTTHLTWIRWFLGSFIGGLGIRVLFLPKSVI